MQIGPGTYLNRCYSRHLNRICIVEHRHEMRNKDIEYTEDIKECVEFILQNKAGWTDFTTWYTQRQGVGHTKANRMWKKSLTAISEQFQDEINDNVNATFIELENLKQRAKENNDRKNELDAIKYQAKLKGLEVERQQVDVNVKSVELSWGDNQTETKN